MRKPAETPTRMFQRFNVQAREAMDRATAKARELGHAFVEPEHLLQSLAEDGEASFHGVMHGLALSPAGFASVPLPASRPRGRASEHPVFSPGARRVLAYTVEEADRLGHKRVGTSHLLLGLIRDAFERPGGTRLFGDIGLSLDTARARVSELATEGANEAGTRDVVPAILFFELDRRAREAEAALEQRIDQLHAENQRLRQMVELLADRLGRTEAMLGRGGRL